MGFYDYKIKNPFCMRKFWSVVVTLILVVVIVTSLLLVKDKFVNENICPKVLGIPRLLYSSFLFWITIDYSVITHLS